MNIETNQEISPRILIIDDNPSIHRDFELVLQDHPEDAELEADERRMYGASAAPAVLKPAYLLDHSLSGLEGVEKVQHALAEQRSYQLAFVDIRMPGIDGVETIQRIWETDPRVQVVICTAFADYSWEDLIRRLGQTDKLLVLKKPFDSIEVTLLASTLTEKWFLARQAALKQEEMERLVARRTRKLLDLQRAEPLAKELAQAASDTAGFAEELPGDSSLPSEAVDDLLRQRGKLPKGLNPESNAQPRCLAANQADAQFLRRAIETVDRHLSDFEFDVEALAEALAVSRRQLFRKLKAVTEGTPNTLIRSMRLNRAAQLLKESQMTVTEITYAVGFSDLKHFRSVFREQFGVLPGEYTRKAQRK
jgi:AraC-like DNA-binding protein/DNA-binding response OmpR family regulator